MKALVTFEQAFYTTVKFLFALLLISFFGGIVVGLIALIVNH